MKFIVNCKVAEFIFTIQDNGAETLVKDYVLMLDKSKIDPIVIVVLRRRNTANDKILSESDAKIFSIYNLFNGNSLIDRIFRKITGWWYIPYRLKKIIHNENIDVLHIHLPLMHYVKKISKALQSVRCFYTCHSEPRLLLSEKRKYENTAAKYLIMHNNLQMIALHENMRMEINKMLGINNTIVIRNGVDFNRFKNIAETCNEIRASISIPSDAFVVGHVGRFDECKNHDFLADVFAELCKREKNAFLFMIGAGELKLHIENKLDSYGLKGRYLVLSHRSDIPLLMKAMDVFVFPSPNEGLGIVLIEAQLSGLRCIISDTVPDEAFQTELAVPMSLKAPISSWCNAILDNSLKGKKSGNIEDYDMNKEIRKLENIYLGESHGCIKN